MCGGATGIYPQTAVNAFVEGRKATGSANGTSPGRRAGRELARLMERQLGYEEGRIDNVALRLFVRAHWSRITKLAHEIHDDCE